MKDSCDKKDCRYWRDTPLGDSHAKCMTCCHSAWLPQSEKDNYKPIESLMNIKLRRYYCQNADTGKKVRCWYSRGNLHTASDAVTIYAKTYCDNLSEVFPTDRVENDTDSMTDYFEKDRVRILPGDPLWDDACAMAAAKKGRK